MIVFEKDISETNLLFAHNNNIVEFEAPPSAPFFFEAVKCEITFQGDTVTIYPSPNGKFWYNFKSWISSIATEDRFIDDLDVDIDGTMIYNYGWSHRTIVGGQAEFKVFRKNTINPESIIKNIYFLNGVLQVEDFRNRYPLDILKSEIKVLSPLEKGSNKSTFIKYWEGFPFDFTVFLGQPLSEDYKITNNNTFQDVFVNDYETVSRTFLSDGRTNIGLTNELIINNGFTDLIINKGTDNDFRIRLEKISGCGYTGHYFKWQNSMGGYSYWLFRKGNRARSYSSLGEINNDFENIPETVSPTINLGQESNDSLTVGASGLNESEANLLIDIFESPAIFMFTGKPYDRNNFNDWISVKLKNSSPRIVNSKNKIVNLELNFSLPERNTIKL